VEKKMENQNQFKARTNPSSGQSSDYSLFETQSSVSLLNQRGESVVSFSFFMGLFLLVTGLLIFIGNHYQNKTQNYLKDFQYEWQKLQKKYPPTHSHRPDGSSF
jgi:hypothetical protein